MRKLLKNAALMAVVIGSASGLPVLAQQAYVPGVVKAEVYSGFAGTALADLTNNAAYPDNPSSISFVKFVEYPAGSDDGRPPGGDVGANYGVRVSGFITPTESANYVFYLASDDAGAFFLSSGEDPANLQLLAWEPTWNAVRAFEIDGSGGRVGCLEGNCENISDPIPLVANQRYYFEALMKEAGGGDNLAVAWAKEGELLETLAYPNPDPLIGGELITPLPIGAEFLGTMEDTEVAITRQPASTAAGEGNTATFSVGINATTGVTYQWRKNGTDIAGATSAAYTTPALTAADNDATYSVVATKAGANSVTSADATLAVVGLSETPGVVLFEVWSGIGGTAVIRDLSTLPPPSEYALPNAISVDLVYTDDTHDNYLAKMSGYFIPSVSGNYNFFVSSDDASALWISTDTTFPDTATEAPVAQETDCCGAFMEPFITNDDGTTYPTTEVPIAMVAGQKYAFIFLVKEGGGGDNGRVAFRLEDDFTLADALPAIGAANLAAVVPGLGITVHPGDISVEENRSGTFSVSTLSTPGVTFQWQTAPAGSATFSDVTDGTSNTLTVNAPRADDGRQYRVVVSAGADSVTSNPGVLTVTDDVTPPEIADVGSFHNLTGLLVYFNEPVNAATGTFTLSGGATVQSATQIGASTVFLQTGAALTANTSYTVTVANVRDLSANGGNLVTPNTATFTSSPAAPTPLTAAFAKYQRWEFLSPNTIDQLIINITNLPPDIEEALLTFEAPSAISDTYGGRLTGWVIPPEDGDYIFAMATDDQGRLWLSTDSNPENKKLIAIETVWSGVRAWSGIPQKNSSTYTGTEWPGGNRISLKGGQPYYIELIWQDGTGGDNGSATFWKAEDPMPGNGTQTAIRGSALLGNIVSDGRPIILEGPVGQVFDKGDDITLSVTVDGTAPFTYQWIRNKRPVAGATSATYTITDADHHAVGDYSVLVANAVASVESNYRGADDTARLMMTGGYNIEAEDYNYEGGKHLPIASTMPYLGDAYAGLLPTLDVDYFNDIDQSTASADADQYGPRMPISSAGTIETKGGNADAVNNELNRNRGHFTVTANYALGWGNIGDWQNYTRTFPAGRYAVFAAVAQDGAPDLDPAFPDPASRTISMNSTLSKVANPTVADGSSIGVEGGGQGLTPLGVFQSPFSGAWSSADIIPLTDETTGAAVEIQLDGTETLRWTVNSGQDSDYLLFYCLDCPDLPSGVTASITRDGNSITISSSGGGTVQASDNLSTPNWTDIGAAPQTVDATGAQRYFRIRN